MQHQRFSRWSGLLLVCMLACGDEDSGGTSVTAYCSRICARVEAADCRGDGGDCDEVCLEMFESVPSKCEDEREEYLKCASRAEWECDADDESDVPDCNAKATAFARCTGTGGGTIDNDAGTSNPDAGRDAGVVGNDAGRDAGSDAGRVDGGAADVACATYCVPVVAVGCSLENDQSVCVANCVDLASQYAVDGCATEFTDVLTCFQAATITCDDVGYTQTDECNPEFAALDTCANGPAPVCTPQGTSECDTCIAANCCAEQTACGDDCQAFAGCYGACALGDTACLGVCDSTYPVAAQSAWSAVVTCAQPACASCFSG